MAIQKLFSSLSKSANLATYVGEPGRMFYDPQNGQLRLSNGVTPGGTAISISANVVISESLLPEADNVYSLGTESLRWHHVHLGDGGVYFDGLSYPTPQTVPYIPGALVTSLIPAPTDASLNLGSSTHRFGNLYIGSSSVHFLDQTTLEDVSLSVDNGTVFINGAENLVVGNLVILNTTIGTKTIIEDVNIGNTNDTGVFNVKRKAQFNNTTFGATEALVSINANGGPPPLAIFPDTLLQVVGRVDKNSRIIQRAQGSTGDVGGDNAYSVWASYASRGNVAYPTAIKQNDILSRLSSNGFGTTTWGAGGTRIESVATENFTDTAKGSKIIFWTTPAGSILPEPVASVNSIGLVANSIQFSTDSSIQTTAGIPLTQKAIQGAAYVATLGGDGKLDATQIPSSLTGAVVIKGSWDASTNTPTLSDSLPAGVTAGWEYVVTVGGTRDIGDGSENFVAGDFVIYDGTHWKRLAASNNLTYATATTGTHIKINGNVGTQEIGVLTFTTDATPNATLNTIVSRDAAGNFQANIITAALSGQATSALTAATVTAGAQNNITSVGTLTSLTVSGNVTAGNVSGTTISGTTGSFTNIAGTLNTAAQTNITSVGTLASLAVTGNVTGGNVITGGSVSDSVGLLRSIPQNSKNTGYTLQATDNGQMINITTGNVTVPASVFNSPYGQTVSIYNNQTTSNAVVQGSGVTLRLAGTTATGNRTLSRYGVATIICVAANTFVISGAGLS